MKLFILALILGFSSTSLAQSRTCSQAEIDRTAISLDSARKRLLDLPIGDGTNTDVSPKAQGAIAKMKDAIANFVDAYVHCLPARPEVGQMEEELSRLGHAFELPPGNISNEDLPADLGKYGFELGFHIRRMSNPDLIGITVNFSIECGGDTVLLLYAPDGDSWKQVLRWQKGPYATVGGGTLCFDYGVSLNDESGRWFLVTHDVAPWCSSTWSSIRYMVLRPTTEPLHPKVLLSASDEIWWGNEDFGTVRVARDSFDLRFHAASVDSGVHNRVWVRHFVVVGDAVQRTQPVAVSPRDFVDEWIVSRWEQATRWSSDEHKSELRQAHRRLLRKERSTRSLLEYYAAYKCSDRPDHYQVEIAEELSPKFEVERSFYFQVLGTTTYTMQRVSEKPDLNCQEPNILETMETK